MTEELDYVPACFQVIRHRRPKYACRTCDTVLQAPAPVLPIPRGRPSAGFLAQILAAKYCRHMPLYRQAGMYAAEGIEIERSTLADWVEPPVPTTDLPFYLDPGAGGPTGARIIGGSPAVTGRPRISLCHRLNSVFGTWRCRLAAPPWRASARRAGCGMDQE